MDRAIAVGSSWRRHYDRLHLHTDRKHSALPYLAFPSGSQRYPSREQVIAYLEEYVRRFDLVPRFSEEVQTIRPANGRWITTTTSGVYDSRQVVVATGYNDLPHVPRWPGQERFTGRIIHSSEYRNGRPFRGQRVLVVGFGNSGGEIAIDLHEHGARVAIAVRNAVNIIPRDILGLPVVAVGIALSRLPSRFTDAMTAPLLKLTVGDITRLGFRKLPFGPVTQIKTKAQIPLIDIGTVKLIRQGNAEVVGDVREISETAVTFDDAKSQHFDSIILATGFRRGSDRFFDRSNEAQTRPGLYFCGFRVSPTGMLREIGLEAQRIAAEIARR